MFLPLLSFFHPSAPPHCGVHSPLARLAHCCVGGSAASEMHSSRKKRKKWAKENKLAFSVIVINTSGDPCKRNVLSFHTFSSSYLIIGLWASFSPRQCKLIIFDHHFAHKWVILSTYRLVMYHWRLWLIYLRELWLIFVSVCWSSIGLVMVSSLWCSVNNVGL